MGIMSWITNKLHGHATQERVDHALSETDDVITRSRSIREQLEPFRRESDPFAAIAEWHKISEDFTFRELRGPIR